MSARHKKEMRTLADRDIVRVAFSSDTPKSRMMSSIPEDMIAEPTYLVPRNVSKKRHRRQERDRAVHAEGQKAKDAGGEEFLLG